MRPLENPCPVVVEMISQYEVLVSFIGDSKVLKATCEIRVACIALSQHSSNGTDSKNPSGATLDALS